LPLDGIGPAAGDGSAEFPANREKNSEFIVFRRFCAETASKSRLMTATCAKIPYAGEQGKIFGRTGN